MRVTPARVETERTWVADRGTVVVPLINRLRNDLGEAFDTAAPDSVSISAHAADTGRSIEEVWEDVCAWKTARRRITLLERALTGESDDATDRQTAV